MIRCGECGARELGGALFCSECGASFVEELSAEPEYVPLRNEEGSDQQVSSKELGTRQVTFFIPSSRRSVRVPLDDRIEVGRADRRREHVPQLDLTEDRGAEHGVSRHHALIQNSSSDVLILDPGSTNGTFLNERRLPENFPFPLRSGDKVRFGRLVVHITID